MTAAPKSALGKETQVQAIGIYEMKIPQWMRGFALAEEAPAAPSALALEHGATSQKTLFLLEKEAEGAAQRELSCPGSLSLAVCSEQ